VKATNGVTTEEHEQLGEPQETKVGKGGKAEAAKTTARRRRRSERQTAKDNEQTGFVRCRKDGLFLTLDQEKANSELEGKSGRIRIIILLKGWFYLKIEIRSRA
jgi:hypothetical protein